MFGYFSCSLTEVQKSALPNIKHSCLKIPKLWSSSGDSSSLTKNTLLKQMYHSLNQVCNVKCFTLARWKQGMNHWLFCSCTGMCHQSVSGNLYLQQNDKKEGMEILIFFTLIIVKYFQHLPKGVPRCLTNTFPLFKAGFALSQKKRPLSHHTPPPQASKNQKKNWGQTVLAML